MSKKKKSVDSLKHFKLPGNNNRLPKPTAPQDPPVVQLTLANAPLWQAKFLEGLRDETKGVKEELAGIRKFLESHV